MLAETPEPPYYAVIFSSVRTAGDDAAYGAMAERMAALASQQPGFLGMESAREEVGITVSYWRDLDSIRAWKRHAEHLEAQRLGRRRWYGRFHLRVARVERAYAFSREDGTPAATRELASAAD